MNQKFNPNRPHGTVYGHSEISHEQDGQLFRADGSMIDKEQLQLDENLLIVRELDKASNAITNVKQSRSDAIKAGLARKRAQEGA